MLFNSLEFVGFFAVVVAVLFSLPSRWRWAFLLIASYFFYALWNVKYLALIAACTLINYFTALQVARTADLRRKKRYLASGVGASLAILFTFKYFDFFNQSLRDGLRLFDVFYSVPALQWALPIGISFFTFQSVGYTIDVYRGTVKPERHLGIFALFVSFFPQLAAGPIARSSTLLPQFHQARSFSFLRLKEGLGLMCFGLFKKLVIADRLAVYVNEVFTHPGGYEGAPVIVAAYFFAIQIYCDFSGYSDIAVGIARVMGYDLMTNFNNPYRAKSFSEFWSRWHISLSTWFRDYLYIPLGGNRAGRLKLVRNLVIVFLASALWHGAAWTFLVWGMLHVSYLIVEVLTAGLRSRLASRIQSPIATGIVHAVKVVVVFHLVTFAWMFFKADSVGDVGLLLHGAVAKPFAIDDIFIAAVGHYEILVGIGAIILMEAFSGGGGKGDFVRFMELRRPVVRWGILYALILGILVLGQFSLNEFIYFQF